MADVTGAQLRQRARYWQARAEREADTKKRAEYRERADILEREADAIGAQCCARAAGYAAGNRMPGT